VVLQENFVYLYNKLHDKTPARVIFVEGMHVDMCDEDLYPGYYGIELIASEHTTTVFTRSKTLRLSWMRALRKAAKCFPVTDFYDIGVEIGAGRFSSIHLGTHKKTLKQYAIKMIDKSKVGDADRESLRCEIAVLKLVDHPSVIRMHEVFETSRYIYIVLTLVCGGDLQDKLCKVTRFEESTTQHVMRTLLVAIAYLHARGIVHRDIKPENILLPESDDDLCKRLLLTDFGLSRFAVPSEVMRIGCGTLTYIAPEMLLCQGYTAAVDLWGAGILMYQMLCGELPFDGKTNTDIITNIIQEPLPFKEPVWKSAVSAEARDFLERLLQKDPKKRITMEQAFAHPWLATAPAAEETKKKATTGSTSSTTTYPTPVTTATATTATSESKESKQ
jgi:serine/threonine protein kinase